jgi:hypothetical protein
MLALRRSPRQVVVADEHFDGPNMINCNGLQTVSDGLANKGHFQLTFRANKRRLGLTLPANEPAFWANSLQTAF